MAGQSACRAASNHHLGENTNSTPGAQTQLRAVGQWRGGGRIPREGIPAGGSIGKGAEGGCARTKSQVVRLGPGRGGARGGPGCKVSKAQAEWP